MVLHPTNRAVTERMNEAVAMAGGEYLSILYSDDFYLPHKLERQLSEHKKKYRNRKHPSEEPLRRATGT